MFFLCTTQVNTVNVTEELKLNLSAFYIFIFLVNVSVCFSFDKIHFKSCFAF